MSAIRTSVKNDQYIKTLAKEIRAVPGKVLAAATIAGFKAAVRHTYMDSGQFASNWQIYAGARPHFVSEKKLRGKHGPLKRGSKLTEKGGSDQIFSAVMREKGLPESPYAQFSHTDFYLKVSTSRIQKTAISNPFWDSKYGSSDSYNPNGYSSYKSRAAIRPGHMVDKAITKAATRAAYRTLKSLGDS